MNEEERANDRYKEAMSKLVKTDSRGRIDLGPEKAGREFSIREFKEWTQPVTDKAQDYIRSFGLDPLVILKDDAGPDGYFVKGDSGHYSWPEGFSWDEFLDIDSANY